VAQNKVALEVRSFRDAKRDFQSLVKAMDPATSSSQVYALYRVAQKEIQDALSKGGQFARDAVRSMAAATHAPRRLYSGSKPAIFSFADFDAATDNRRKRSVLVGVRTGLNPKASDPNLYIQWSPKSNIRKKDGSKIRDKWLGMRFGDKGLSMSLGTLFERGTQNRRIKPKNFFRFGVAAASSRILAGVGNAYKRAVQVLNKNTN
jgi:hypothetical protein